jgi:trehalose 6-phosphate phosphatase
MSAWTSSRGDVVEDPLTLEINAFSETSQPKRSALRDQGPPSALRSWRKISERVKAAGNVVLFLDFDGTLVGLQPRPEDVRVPKGLRQLLRRLARHERVIVVIASGRRVRDLKRLIGLKRLRYFGVHGAEPQGGGVPLSKGTRAVLRDAHCSFVREAAQLRGLWVEPKGISFAVHYRRAASPSVLRARQSLLRIVGDSGDVLRILNGKKVWEVLPREIGGKWGVVERVMREVPEGAGIIYIGDDETDEEAFRVLPDQITVAVGKRSGTRARYYLPSSASVLRFLAQLEKELP